MTNHFAYAGAQSAANLIEMSAWATMTAGAVSGAWLFSNSTITLALAAFASAVVSGLVLLSISHILKVLIISAQNSDRSADALENLVKAQPKRP